MNIILASSSPRRKEILKTVGFDFTIHPADIDESKTNCDCATDLVKELSYEKANAVYEKEKSPDALILGADTIVVYNNEILGKPKDQEDAYNMIALLQDRTHSVYTGVTLIWNQKGAKKVITFYETSKVSLYPIDSYDIKAYVKSGEPFDKAGSYGIQGSFSKHVKSIEGEYNNVVGLPIGRIYHELIKNKLYPKTTKQDA